jgi:hypothetical protein
VHKFYKIEQTKTRQYQTPNQTKKNREKVREALDATLNHGRRNSITPGLNSRNENGNRNFHCARPEQNFTTLPAAGNQLPTVLLGYCLHNDCPKGYLLDLFQKQLEREGYHMTTRMREVSRTETAGGRAKGEGIIDKRNE